MHRAVVCMKANLKAHTSNALAQTLRYNSTIRHIHIELQIDDETNKLRFFCFGRELQ